MKCPYRTVKKILKNKYDSCYEVRLTEVYESFADCYKEDCPLYVEGECVRIKIEKGDEYE